MATQRQLQYRAQQQLRGNTPQASDVWRWQGFIAPGVGRITNASGVEIVAPVQGNCSTAIGAQVLYIPGQPTGVIRLKEVVVPGVPQQLVPEMLADLKYAFWRAYSDRIDIYIAGSHPCEKAMTVTAPVALESFAYTGGATILGITLDNLGPRKNDWVLTFAGCDAIRDAGGGRLFIQTKYGRTGETYTYTESEYPAVGELRLYGLPAQKLVTVSAGNLSYFASARNPIVAVQSRTPVGVSDPSAYDTFSFEKGVVVRSVAGDVLTSAGVITARGIAFQSISAADLGSAPIPLLGVSPNLNRALVYPSLDFQRATIHPLNIVYENASSTVAASFPRSPGPLFAFNKNFESRGTPVNIALISGTSEREININDVTSLAGSTAPPLIETRTVKLIGVDEALVEDVLVTQLSDMSNAAAARFDPAYMPSKVWISEFGRIPD